MTGYSDCSHEYQLANARTSTKGLYLMAWIAPQTEKKKKEGLEKPLSNSTNQRNDRKIITKLSDECGHQICMKLIFLR